MDDQNKNLLLAIALSFLVILVWFILFPPPEPVPPETQVVATEAPPASANVAPEAGSGTAATGGAEAAGGIGATAEEAPRLPVDTARLSGTISLVGGRLDDLSLKDYRVTVAEDSDIVRLLSAAGTAGAQYALAGWAPADGSIAADQLPGPDTLWQSTGAERLTTETPLTLTWTSPAGLAFTREIAVDEDFMFTITDRVVNGGPSPVSLRAYGVVERQGIPPEIKNFFILHEGIVQMADGTLTEMTYRDISEETVIPDEGGPTALSEVTRNGWIGFTDHYWQTILIPSPGQPFTAVAKHIPAQDLYRTSVRQPAVTLAPGEETTSSLRIFAGAKEWETIRTYQNIGNVDRFIDSIDWGWFFFLTKPIFAVLHWLNQLIGNMGLAIIGLTFIIKLILFPLARKSYISMARMKELQPELEKLKERVGDDRQRMQKEMMELYKREKVNPAAGCRPILLQIPIFFSLYKVIFVTIELRHAPFFGWLNDLSAPDPTSLWNAWGLLPWAAPETGSILHLIFVGVLPLLLGISMWFQQKLNPAPTDPTQAAIFAWMPWIFMFMLGSFASGLILYWITNNTITFIQQYVIMRSHGHTPDLFGNIRASFRRKKAAPPASAPKKPGGK